MLKHIFIESDRDLENICKDLSEEKIIGMDIEADSMHCFNEKVCLIQIASAKQAFLIDPFSIRNFSPFVKIVEDEAIIKVLHGSDFDIRSLDRDFNIRLRNLFDTEIACRFLGIKDRSLAALLKKYFNVIVDKRFQKVDWSKRPLKKEMISYSVSDVAYLIELYTIIRDKLGKIDRLSWVKEEFESQEKVRYQANNQFPLFKKFKGGGRMDSISLAVLENLLKLRLKIAQKKNQPLFKIMSNKALKTMAEKKPVTWERLLKTGALSKKQINMYGTPCIDKIIQALKTDRKDLPCYPKNPSSPKTAEACRRISNLKKMREKQSLMTGMEPGFLINNSLIDSIASNNPYSKEELKEIKNMRQWQIQAIGENIMETLNRQNGG